MQAQKHPMLPCKYLETIIMVKGLFSYNLTLLQHTFTWLIATWCSKCLWVSSNHDSQHVLSLCRIVATKYAHPGELQGPLWARLRKIGSFTRESSLGRGKELRLRTCVRHTMSFLFKELFFIQSKNHALISPWIIRTLPPLLEEYDCVLIKV